VLGRTAHSLCRASSATLFPPARPSFLTAAIPLLGSLQLPASCGAAALVATVAAPRAARREMTTATGQQAFATSRLAAGSLYCRQRLIMLKWAHGRVAPERSSLGSKVPASVRGDFLLGQRSRRPRPIYSN